MNDSSKHKRSPSDQALEEWVARSLGETSELIPTTEAEVARAEAAGLEFESELPESLANFAPHAPAKKTPSEVLSLQDVSRRLPPKRAWAGHALSAILSAAASIAMTWWLVYKPPQKVTIGPEPLASSERSPMRPAGSATIALGVPQECAEGCCAGIDCPKASKDLHECASQRRCIRCTESDHADDRYRVRIGRLAPTEAGRAELEAANGRTLQTCVRVSGSEFACTPAQDKGDNEEPWASLPLVASAADLLVQMTVQLRWSNAAEPLAEWSTPIQSNPTVLCNGLSIKPKRPDGTVLGVLSAFLDDTYFVELERAALTAKLVTSIERYSVSGAALKIYETTAKTDARFALTVGPMSKKSAEKVRWSVLHAGGTPRIVIGADYMGAPSPN